MIQDGLTRIAMPKQNGDGILKSKAMTKYLKRFGYLIISIIMPPLER